MAETEIERFGLVGCELEREVAASLGADVEEVGSLDGREPRVRILVSECQATHPAFHPPARLAGKRDVRAFPRRERQQPALTGGHGDAVALASLGREVDPFDGIMTGWQGLEDVLARVGHLDVPVEDGIGLPVDPV